MSNFEPRSRYRPIDPAIWTDRRIHALSPMPPNPLGLLFFLKTCGQGGLIPGVVPLGVAAASEILGWDPQDFLKQLDELHEVGFVKVDVRARLIYLVGAVHDQPPANPNIVTGWRRTWHEAMDCPLKAEIWQELHEAMKERGKEFEAAFLRACPNGSANGLGNSSRNGSVNSSLKGSGNKDKDQEQDQEQEKETDKDSGSGPGQVCPPPGGISGQEGGLGPGQSPESCLGLAPGHVPGHAPGPDTPEESGPIPGEADQPRRRVQIPDSRCAETIDDIEAREPGQAPPAQALPVAPQGDAVAGFSTIPPAVRKVIDEWHKRVVAKAPNIFPRYEEDEAHAKLPTALKAMEDPRSEQGFDVLFEAIPRLPFYQGGGDRGFVANLGHYFKKFAAGDFKCVVVAEDQLKREFQIDIKASKPKSRAEAEAIRLRTSGSIQVPAAANNNLAERLHKGRE